MRKLKTIYDVYNCCVEQACENGLNTEACEQQLEEATCMYWEGSIYSMMAKILMSMITNAITGILVSLIAANILACVYAVFKIIQVPQVIMGVISSWEYMGRTFEEPMCEDLGFDAIKTDSQQAMDEAAEAGFEDVNEETLENWERITLVDQNDDGVYDYHAPVWTPVEGKAKTYTSTVRSYDAKEKKYVTSTYTKKDGKITDDKNKPIGFLAWQSIQGSNIPAPAPIQPKSNRVPTTETINGITITRKPGTTESGSQLENSQEYSIISNNEGGSTYYLKKGDTIPNGYFDSQVEMTGAEIKKLGEAGTEVIDPRTILVYGVTPPVIDVDRATLTIGSQTYEKIPLSLIDEIGGVSNIESVQSLGGETTIKLKDERSVNVDSNGNNAEVFNKDGTSAATWNIQGTTVTKTSGNQRTVESSFQGTGGNTVMVTKHLTSTAKDITSFSLSQDVEIKINGKTTTISPESFRQLSLTNNQQEIDNLAQAFVELGEPEIMSTKKSSGYTHFSAGRKDPSTAAKSIAISDSGKQTRVTEWDGKEEIITHMDKTDPQNIKKRITVSKTEFGIPIEGTEYNFHINPTTGEIIGFGQIGGGITFNNKPIKRGSVDIYHSDSTIGDPAKEGAYEIGFDQNGEMWLSDGKDWKKASDNQFKDVRNILGFKEIEKAGKDIMEKRATIEQKEKEIIENKKTTTQDKIAQKKAEYDAAYNMMYESVWTLLDLTLSEPINDAIADQCKSDSDKSYPPSDTATDSSAVIGSSTGGGPCQGINIYNAQFISNTPLANGNCEYAITYGISTCSSAIGYNIFLDGTQGRETVESGNLNPGQFISINRIIESQICTHQSACITTNDGHNQCYPPLP